MNEKHGLQERQVVVAFSANCFCLLLTEEDIFPFYRERSIFTVFQPLQENKIAHLLNGVERIIDTPVLKPIPKGVDLRAEGGVGYHITGVLI